MKIIWHDRAVDDLYLILMYCLDKFGRTTAQKVRKKIIDDIKLLRSHPFVGSKMDVFDGINSLEYRSIIVNQTKVIYSIHSDHIYIHILWNTNKDDQMIGEELNRRTSTNKQ